MAAVLVPGCASEPSTGTVTAKSYQPGMWIEKPYSHKCGQQTCTSTRPTFIPPSYFLTTPIEELEAGPVPSHRVCLLRLPARRQVDRRPCQPRERDLPAAGGGLRAGPSVVRERAGHSACEVGPVCPQIAAHLRHAAAIDAAADRVPIGEGHRFHATAAAETVGLVMRL